MVSDWNAADDIMQETSEVMWSKYSQAKPIANFSAWAIRIAHNKILNHLAKKNRQQLVFDTEVLEDVAARAEQVSFQMNERISALRRCMAGLSERDRNMLKMRYESNKTIKDISQQLGRPIHGMYKAMARIHDKLTKCVRQKLTLESDI